MPELNKDQFTHPARYTGYPVDSQGNSVSLEKSLDGRQAYHHDSLSSLRSMADQHPAGFRADPDTLEVKPSDIHHWEVHEASGRGTRRVGTYAKGKFTDE